MSERSKITRQGAVRRLDEQIQQLTQQSQRLTQTIENLKYLRADLLAGHDPTAHRPDLVDVQNTGTQELTLEEKQRADAAKERVMTEWRNRSRVS